MLPHSHHKNPDGISQSLPKQIAPNNNHGEPQMPFSIRQYALACRQKDIFSNWPFPEKYLQICLNRGISDVLPPFESHKSAIRSLGGAIGLNCTQKDDENVDYFENKEPDTIEQEIEGDTIEQEIEDHTIDQEIEDHTIEQEIEDDTIEQKIEDNMIGQEIEDHTNVQEIEDHTNVKEIEAHTIEQEIEHHTIEQETEDHMMEPEIEDHTIEQETEDHSIEQEIKDHTIVQEIEHHTIVQEFEHHTIEQEIEDECKLYSETEEAISELSIQHCHVSPSNSSHKHEENKTDFGPLVASDVIVSTDQPSTTIPSSHLKVVRRNKTLASSKKPRHMKKQHKNKLKKRSMENILTVAKLCTSEDLLRIKRLCCVSSVPLEQAGEGPSLEQADEGIEHMTDVMHDCNSDLTKDYSSEKLEGDENEAADLSPSRKRFVVKFKFSGCKSNILQQN